MSPVRDLGPARKDMQKLAREWADGSWEAAIQKHLQGIHYAPSEADRWDARKYRCTEGGTRHGPGVITNGYKHRICSACHGDLNEHEHIYELGYDHCVRCVPPPKQRDYRAEALEELSVFDPPAWLTDVPSSASNQPRRSSPWARPVATLVQMLLGAGSAFIVDRFIWNLWP